jgi:hypothetical protein
MSFLCVQPVNGHHHRNNCVVILRMSIWAIIIEWFMNTRLFYCRRRGSVKEAADGWMALDEKCTRKEARSNAPQNHIKLTSRAALMPYPSSSHNQHFNQTTSQQISSLIIIIKEAGEEGHLRRSTEELSSGQ